MDDKQLREALSLKPEATDEEVLAKVKELNAPPAGDAGEGAGGGDGQLTLDDAATGSAPAAESAPQPVAAGSPPEGTVLMSSAQLDELKASAEAGKAAMRLLTQQEDDQILASAIREGRITPAEAGTQEAPGPMRKRLQTEGLRESTKVLLTAAPEDGGLAKGSIPVQEFGGAGSDVLAASENTLYEEWSKTFPTTGDDA